MSIEIYNKAKIVRKEGIFYYFLKYHSRNDRICGGQVIVDDNFNDKYIRRDSSAGSWSIKAHGYEDAVRNDLIALTQWNCPTSSIYGEIRFGNKMNIALYWARNKKKYIDYTKLSDMQKKNVDEIIGYYLKGEYQCDLANIPEKYQFEAEHTYCGTKYGIADYSNYKEYYEDRLFWSLDNLLTSYVSWLLEHNGLVDMKGIVYWAGRVEALRADINNI